VLPSVAARLATQEVVSSVVVGTRGPVALHASRSTSGDDDIAVVIDRCRPLELTPSIMEAYDLMPRESEVTQFVLRGSTTAQIARALDVSNYTVQGHLKSIFGKVAVPTRGELANELHVRFFLPR